MSPASTCHFENRENRCLAHDDMLPTLVLRIPSIYRTPPAAQRMRYRTRALVPYMIELEVEEGATSSDYDAMFGPLLTFHGKDDENVGPMTPDLTCEIRDGAVLPLQPVIGGGGLGDTMSTDFQKLFNRQQASIT